MVLGHGVVAGWVGRTDLPPGRCLFRYSAFMLRRDFFALSLAPGLALMARQARAGYPGMKISLAEWSLHRAIQARLMTNLDFPRVAREQFGIAGLEFVNQLWEAPTDRYVGQLSKNMADTGTEGVLIMCDGEGAMGHSRKAERLQAARNHHKWVDIAKELGCHAIRCNMYPDDDPKSAGEINDFVKRCVESFSALCEYAAKQEIAVAIENHGGLSSDADVLVRVIETANLANFGTLPDFGNFAEGTDIYGSIEKMMPHAKALSVKCLDFDAKGNETSMDLGRLMKIAVDGGYSGWAGIEFGGRRLTEFEGIQACKRFLERG